MDFLEPLLISLIDSATKDLVDDLRSLSSGAEAVFLFTPMINKSVLTLRTSAELTLFAVKLDKTL
jgi:hypothetical protein